MAGVEKVTISLPAELLRLVEQQRAAGGRSRSEVVTDLLWRGWRAIENEAMEEEYRLAYARQPETEEERARAEWTADELFASNDDDWSEYWSSESAAPPPENRAAG
jgi:metal-responsive CopG/Arc/MetJ family transcriptional regulator